MDAIKISILPAGGETAASPTSNSFHPP